MRTEEDDGKGSRMKVVKKDPKVVGITEKQAVLLRTNQVSNLNSRQTLKNQEKKKI